MKTTGRWIFAAFLGLSLLSLNVSAGAEDDWAHQQAQAQREREEWQRQQEQAQREQAQREREQAQKERDDWYRQQAQTQKERDDWYAQQAQAQREREQAERDQKERDDWYKQQQQVQRDYQQSILNGIERVKQQRDEILNKVYDEHPWAGAGWTAAGKRGGPAQSTTGWRPADSV